jgi:hypothetical protein
MRRARSGRCLHVSHDRSHPGRLLFLALLFTWTRTTSCVCTFYPGSYTRTNACIARFVWIAVFFYLHVCSRSGPTFFPMHAVVFFLLNPHMKTFYVVNFLRYFIVAFSSPLFPTGVQPASKVQRYATKTLCSHPQCCAAADSVLWKHRQGVVSFHHRCFNGRCQYWNFCCCEPFSLTIFYCYKHMVFYCNSYSLRFLFEITGHFCCKSMHQ